MNTTAVAGFTGSINLSVSGLPANATGTFVPASVTAGSSSTLTVATATNTPTGSFTLTITGTSGTLTHTATVSLNVTSGSGSSGKVISIDFVGQDVAMAATEIAGVVAKPNWNNASGASSAASLALVDETGAATSASATWASNNVWQLPTTDQAGNARMMKGYLDTSATSTTTVTIAGLPSSSNGYSVYVYADGDNNTASRTGNYQISGAGITTTSISLTDAANTNFSGTFTQANNSVGNYVVFTINATSFTISAAPGASTDPFPRAAINGIQIVPLSPPNPDFTVSATPSSQTLNAGGSTPYTVNTSALNGFSGSVSLSVSGLPANATGTFNPASVSAGGSSTLTVATATNTPTGSFTLTVTGTSGSLTRTTTVTLTVTSPDFTVSATPSSQSLNPGGSTPYTVNTAAVAGFTGSINLSVSGLPANATGTFVPASVTAGSSSTLTVATATNTPTGSFTLTITGTSGTLTHTATVSLNVTSGSGSSGKVISIDFVGQDVAMAATEIAGVVAKPNWNNASGASSAASLALVDETGAATSASATWASNNVWQLPTTDQAGNARMMKGYLDTSATSTTTVTIAGLPSSSNGYSVYVYADGDNNTASRTGNYQISGAGITTTSISLTDAANTNFSGTFTQANNSVGNYVVFTINATSFTISAAPGASTDPFPRAAINGIQIVPLSPPNPDFTLSATPSSQTLNAGGSTPYTVNTSALNGFSGSVSLSVSGLPANATGMFNPASVSAGGSSTLTVATATNTPTGSFTLTVTGTSGSLTRTTTVTLTVTSPDFTVSATPSSQSLNPGGSTPYTVNTAAVAGFTGSINLSVSGLPANATGTFVPASVTAGSSSTLTVATATNTPTGSFTLTITGTSGTLTHTATVSLNVTSSGSSGKVISIDFVGQDVAMAATEIAGVVAKPNWNNASGASSAASLALVDETGAATSASATWASNNVWQLPTTDQAGNARMMKGYLDTSATSTTTVTIAGLPSSSNGYSVYVYADGDNNTASRTGNYQISGAGITTTSISLTDAANTNFNGTFTQANNSVGNYVVFTINATSFTISAAPGASTDPFPRAAINGIQIVPN